MRNDWVPLFASRNVDIVISGHAHNYNRGLTNGVTYIISGGGGAVSDELYRDARALGWRVLPSYGMTECCSQVATALSDSPELVNQDPYGRGWMLVVKTSTNLPPDVRRAMARALGRYVRPT